MNEIYGAKGYEIYRSTSYKGPFKEPIYTVDNGHIASYTDNNGGFGLTAGKTYYYEVRAYDTTENGMKKSPYSSCKYTKPIPSVPAIALHRTSPTSINISWSKAAGAAGYEISRATSPNGTYTRIKTSSELSYENTGLYANITYYYKVRAYCKVESATVYGPYSEEKHLWF